MLSVTLMWGQKWKDSCGNLYMSTPPENLQHEIFSIASDVAISPLDVMNSCCTFSNIVFCRYDISYPTTAHSNHVVVDGYLQWHSNLPETLNEVWKFCFEGWMLRRNLKKRRYSASFIHGRVVEGTWEASLSSKYKSWLASSTQFGLQWFTIKTGTRIYCKLLCLATHDPCAFTLCMWGYPT